MTTHAQTQATYTAKPDQLLRNTLRANAVFSLVCGVLLLLDAKPIAEWMGLSSATALMVLGGALLFWAADVAFVATRPTLNKTFAQVIFGADVLWVVGSIAILLFDLFALSTAGKWIVLGVADIVLVISVAEFIGLRRLNQRWT